MLTTTPQAAPITVPGVGLYGASADPGTVLVWKACTSLTQPQS